MQTKAEQKTRKKKATLIAVAVVVAAVVIAGAVFGVLHGRPTAEMDFFDDDLDFTTENYYSGVIEPQQTTEIKRDAARKIKQLLVQVGDSVSAGQTLFEYDTEQESIELNQALLEAEQIGTEIALYESQLRELRAERDAAPEDSKLEYSIQIQSTESDLRQAQLNLKVKNVSIEKIRSTIGNAAVLSPSDGVVKEINETGETEGYLTILATGAYRVKGTVDEMNIGSLEEGMEVLIHSRVDSDQIWKGKITLIDRENTVSTQNNYGYSTENAASKYYFFVSLETSEELLLGQHVYIEPVYDADSVDEEAQA